MQFLNTEEKPRRAAVINDLSGAGKCSLTVMLPVRLGVRDIRAADGGAFHTRRL